MSVRESHSNTDNCEIQPADPSARWRAAAIAGVLAVVGGAAIWGTKRWLAELTAIAERDPGQALAALVAAVDSLALGLAVPLIAIAAYGYLLAYRIGSSRRFPPPGMAVVRDTAVLSGSAAVTRARLLAVLTTLLLAGAVALPWMLIRVVSSLGAAVDQPERDGKGGRGRNLSPAPTLVKRKGEGALHEV